MSDLWGRYGPTVRRIGEFLKNLIEQNRAVKWLESLPIGKRIGFLYGVFLPALIVFAFTARAVVFGISTLTGPEVAVGTGAIIIMGIAWSFLTPF